VTRSDIDVLLLDFGGVVLLHPFELHHRTERLLGLEPGTLNWFGSLDPSTDPLWAETMAGRLTEVEYWDQRAAEVGQLAGRPMSRGDFLDLLYEQPDRELMRDDAFEVVNAARSAGYRVSVLTNDLMTFRGPEWAAKVEFFELMDHVIDCAVAGSLKPNPGAYQAAVDATGVAAERMLFVDDLTANVDGARAAGMEAIFFDVAQPAKSWASVATALGV
jgi:putative hydrolase of the HAD superfamily